MSRGSFYRGTTLEQDGRFKNKEKLVMENKVFPKEYDEALDIRKVDLKVIKVWVEKKINEILCFEDEFLVNYVISLLEDTNELLNPKKIQVLLTGFLDNRAPSFMKELWNLLLSAQTSPNGIPEAIINEKQAEMTKELETKNEKLKFLEKMLGVEGKSSDTKLSQDSKSSRKEVEETRIKPKKESDRKYSDKTTKHKSRNEEKDRKIKKSKKHRRRSRSSSSNSSSSSSRSRRRENKSKGKDRSRK